jgi:hypothetical protein
MGIKVQMRTPNSWAQGIPRFPEDHYDNDILLVPWNVESSALVAIRPTKIGGWMRQLANSLRQTMSISLLQY